MAIVQDGNRRYAYERGADATSGHQQGAKTTERMLRWCEGVGVEGDCGLEYTDIDTNLIETRLYDQPIRDVDLTIRTGGRRTNLELPAVARQRERGRHLFLYRLLA